MQEPNRPAITPAQIIAVLIAGIPATAKLLEAFGVYSLTAPQQDALSGALTWLGVLAGVLIGADAALRAARNAAHAKVAVAAPGPVGTSMQVRVDGREIAKAVAFTEPRPGVAVTNQVTAPTKPEAAAPYTPDGDPLDGEDDDDTDRLAQLPDESFTADPDDTAGADDHPETA